MIPHRVETPVIEPDWLIQDRTREHVARWRFAPAILQRATLNAIARTAKKPSGMERRRMERAKP